MRFRIVAIIILSLLLFNGIGRMHAIPVDIDEEWYDMPDTSRKINQDSLRIERARIADSIRIERAYRTDSARLARQHISDSTQMSRKRKTDSVAAIRKHKESQKYKDSVARVRTRKANSIKKERQAHLDSVQTIRKSLTDSIAQTRKTKTDAIKTVQKKRADSIAKIKKYKTSKRYADSVAIAKHDRSESIRLKQKDFRDSIAKIRKHTLDSSKLVRKRIMDSTKTVRTKHLDSIKLVRKNRTDSLAKVKADKEKLAKAKEKKKESDNKLKLELKIKAKHEAWSNKTMLKKKWSPLRRLLQNSFTHYNYYFNANKKMEEAMMNMQRTQKENYDSLIGLYSFDPNRDSSLLSADMDSIVRKVSVGIQIHDPRVKWSNDMYLLLGQAYYYKGSYENAAIAFRYIISADEEAKKKNASKGGGSGKTPKSKGGPSIMEDQKHSWLDFLKHKSVHNEAILWLARTYTQSNQVENGESILSLVETDPHFPSELKGRLALEKAFAYLTEKNDEEAAKQLSIAAADNNLPDWLRLRAAFLNGQLLQNAGDCKGAVAKFEQALTYYPKLEMDFYARKNIAFNKLQCGGNIVDAMKPLKNVLTDAKYVNYYDQVYYVLGKLAAKANKNQEAINYLTRSANMPKASKKQKAMSFAALGDVYYATASYPYAKRAYDSAAKYAPSGTKDAAVAAAVHRNKGLADISGPSQIIHDQDSLLALSRLSKREQQSAVRKYLNYLEKKQRDSAALAEEGGTNSLPADDGSGDNREASNWYFANATLMQQGKADFARKWGSRPLTDNWRRAAGSNGSSNPNGAQNSSGEDEVVEVTTKENGLPTEASLLAKIPNTDAQKLNAVKTEQKAYIMLAKGYFKQLEDYKQATHTLDTLNIRYPDHNQKEEELYLRYQIAIRQNKLDKAQSYSRELLERFPNSQYAPLLRPKNSESKQDALVAGKTVSAYFDETYALIMQHQYTEALMHVNIAKKQFDDYVFVKRFRVAEAMSYAGAGNFNQADSVISDFLKAYPSDSLTPWATTVKDYIKQVRNGGKPSWYKETPPVDPAIAKAEEAKKEAEIAKAKAEKAATPPPPPEIPDTYTYAADKEHYFVLTLPGIDSRTAAVKKAVQSFNSKKYNEAGLELLIDFYGADQAALVVRKFANAEQAKKYLADIKEAALFADYKETEVRPLVISAYNYKKMFDDKNATPYYGFFNVYYK